MCFRSDNSHVVMQLLKGVSSAKVSGFPTIFSSENLAVLKSPMTDHGSSIKF